MNSGEKNARIVCRMKSVEVTRVMPSRCATSAATVDLPVPVEPPISRMIGTSSDCRSASRRRRPTARSRLLLAEDLARELVETLDLDRPRSPALRQVELDPPRELVRVVGEHAGCDRGRAPSGPSSTAGRRHRAAAARRAGAASCPHRRAARAAARRGPRRPRRSRASTTRIAMRERVLGDDVDRRRLQLDQISVGIDRDRARSSLAVREVRRDMNDVGVEVRDVARTGGEDGDPALRAARLQPQRGARSRVDRRRRRSAGGRCSGTSSPVVPAPDDEDAPVDVDRRDRRAAAVEDDDVRSAAATASRAPSATFETNTAPASPPPARRQPIVGTPASAAISRWSEAAWRPARDSATSSSTVGGISIELRLRRPATSHRDDDDVAVARRAAARGAR